MYSPKVGLYVYVIWVPVGVIPWVGWTWVCHHGNRVRQRASSSPCNETGVSMTLCWFLVYLIRTLWHIVSVSESHHHNLIQINKIWGFGPLTFIWFQNYGHSSDIFLRLVFIWRSKVKNVEYVSLPSFSCVFDDVIATGWK